MECIFLATILDQIDKNDFAVFCPKTARCSKRKRLIDTKKCENYGQYDLQQSKCICLNQFFGEFCQYSKNFFFFNFKI